MELEHPAETMARLGFARKRSRLIVEIDLDPVPGWGNDPEDHARYLQRHLNGAMAHYNPTVTCDS